MIDIEKYKNIEPVATSKRPRMPGFEKKHAMYESRNMNLLFYYYILAVGSIFAVVSVATKNYITAAIGCIWTFGYYLLLIISIRYRMKSDGIYIIADLVKEPDENTGQLILSAVIYEPELKLWDVVENIDYRIYRDMNIGDWCYIYKDMNDISVIPEYPNRVWHEERCSERKT